MNSLNDLNKFAAGLELHEYKMPVLFVGHGSPMNAIEDNEFSKNWNSVENEIVKPKAVLCISAHWETKGTFVTAMKRPKTIHDFYGFPNELFEVEYPAPGSPELAEEIKKIITKTNAELDNQWGLDHGTWSVLKHFYSEANIPVIQLSIDYTKPPEWHYELGKELSSLRNKGVLIIGSGNMVHNLRMLDWHNTEKGYDWAEEMNERFKLLILNGNHKELIDYRSINKDVLLAIPSPEHFIPLLYVLALKEKNEEITFFNDKTIMGSLSMTSLKIS